MAKYFKTHTSTQVVVFCEFIARTSDWNDSPQIEEGTVGLAAIVHPDAGRTGMLLDAL